MWLQKLKKIHPIPLLFLVVAFLSLAVASGGLLALREIGYPEHLIMPQPITAALYYGGLMIFFSIISAAFFARKRSTPFHVNQGSSL